LEQEEIRIAPIKLKWTDWYSWKSLEVDMRRGEGVKIPNKPGVYEAKYADSEERLTIGKASHLQKRVRRGLVRGTLPHSAGTRIRRREDISRIVVRWATTDRPAAVEEELHKKYRAKYDRLPKHTKHT
jgi:excinuclease UvrABC nuclease subunit